MISLDTHTIGITHRVVYIIYFGGVNVVRGKRSKKNDNVDYVTKNKWPSGYT